MLFWIVLERYQKRLMFIQREKSKDYQSEDSRNRVLPVKIDLTVLPLKIDALLLSSSEFL